MMNVTYSKTSYPVRLAAILVSVVLIVLISAKLQVVIVPIIFSLIFSVMLYPLSCKMEKWGMGRALSALISVLFASVILGAFIYFLSSQISSLNEQAPQLAEKIEQLGKRVQWHVYTHYGINKSEQTEQVQHQLDVLADNGAGIIAAIVKSVLSFLTDVLLIPLYIFFLLYFRNFFLEFFHKAISSTDKAIIDEIIVKIYGVIQSWLVGVIVVMVIVGTLNTIGLLALGIPYAAFFGFLAAVLLLIPYIGISIGAILPMIMALITKDSYWYAAGVVAIFWVIQILEGNLITPYIVGSKISINPLVAILVLILFGNLWGISGLILALPITAMCKIIFDAVPGLRPYGFLLGVPRRHHLKNRHLVTRIATSASTTLRPRLPKPRSKSTVE